MVYKEKDAQLEDNRSTAYTFLGVGIAGLIFVILFALDIIKLPMADYMRVIMIVVMSVLFVIKHLMDSRETAPLPQAGKISKSA